MARSIGDWYGDHVSQALGDQFDDERQEAAAPWDAARSRARTATAANQATRGQPTGGAVTSRSPRTNVARGAKTRKRAAGSRAPLVVPDKLKAQIRAAARSQPHLSLKRLARVMHASGIAVTRAQIALVLSQPVVRRRPQSAGSISLRRTTTTVRHGAFSAPVVRAMALSDPVFGAIYCNGCGVRIGPSGLCRCS